MVTVSRIHVPRVAMLGVDVHRSKVRHTERRGEGKKAESSDVSVYFLICSCALTTSHVDINQSIVKMLLILLNTAARLVWSLELWAGFKVLLFLVTWVYGEEQTHRAQFVFSLLHVRREKFKDTWCVCVCGQLGHDRRSAAA